MSIQNYTRFNIFKLWVGPHFPQPRTNSKDLLYGNVKYRGSTVASAALDVMAPRYVEWVWTNKAVLEESNGSRWFGWSHRSSYTAFNDDMEGRVGVWKGM